jgi:hypothetical protein
MKKFVWILLALCLLLGCVVGYAAAKNGAKNQGEPVALYDPENVTDPEPVVVTDEGAEEGPSAALRVLDYEKLWALHAPEEIVGSVDGRDLTWDEYFYWLHNWGVEAESYIQMMLMYGQRVDWTDKLSSESEDTLADYVVDLAKDYALQFKVIEAVAEETGAALTPEDEAALAAQLQETIVSACGEGASEEDFNALLEESFISRAMYDRVTSADYLVNGIYSALYGEKSEKITEDEALGYLEDNGYLYASHILFMTIDPSTYETLDAETIAQKQALAEKVYAELCAIDDPDELVKRFAELKEQYCEDSGKTLNPDGYVFTPGTMVEEFENAVKALEAYEISEPVKSGYGYHVILRLPLSAETVMGYADDNTPVTAREACASEQFSALMTARIEASVLTLNDDVAAIDLMDYLKDAE